MRHSVQRDTRKIEPENRGDNAVGLDCARLWSQFLDDSLHRQVRVIHVEQEDGFCRIRTRAHGLLSEQKLDSATFASDLIQYLQQSLPTATVTDTGLVSHISIGQVECQIECSWYEALRGQVLIIRLHHQRNIPESLEQTTLDPNALMVLRQQLHRKDGGLMIISGRSSELLCDLYYALLGELTALDEKVVSFESAPRKTISRINQVVSGGLYVVPDDTSHVFIDWQQTRNSELLNGLVSRYQRACLFVQAHSLPDAIRQLSDLSHSERQLATNISTLVEIDRVWLICPHCALAQQPGHLEARLLKENGIDANSTLNYANGCSTCEYTGFSEAKTLIAPYENNDLLRQRIEARAHDQLQSALAGNNKVLTIKQQHQALISAGMIEFKLAASG